MSFQTNHLKNETPSMKRGSYLESLLSSSSARPKKLEDFIKYSHGLNEVEEDWDAKNDAIDPDLIYRKRVESAFSMSMPSVIIKGPKVAPPSVNITNIGGQSYLFQTTLFGERGNLNVIKGPWISFKYDCSDKVSSELGMIYYNPSIECSILTKEGKLINAFEVINGSKIEVVWNSARLASWLGSEYRSSTPVVVRASVLTPDGSAFETDLLIAITYSPSVLYKAKTKSIFSNVKFDILTYISPLKMEEDVDTRDY